MNTSLQIALQTVLCPKFCIIADTRPKPYLYSLQTRTYTHARMYTHSEPARSTEPRHPTEWNLDLESGAGARTDPIDQIMCNHITSIGCNVLVW